MGIPKFDKIRAVRSRIPLDLAVFYILMTAGGLWNALGLFQDYMPVLAGPMLIGVSVWAWLIAARTMPEDLRTAMTTWSVLIFVLAMSAEGIGTRTGAIFGPYEYSRTLIPQIGGVPMAIGFAWVMLILTGIAIGQRFIPNFNNLPIVAKTAFISLTMVWFDFFLEPVAIHLDYWQWSGGNVPLQNYLAWFLLGWVFSSLGYFKDIMNRQLPGKLVHIYLGQFIYFFITLWG